MHCASCAVNIDLDLEELDGVIASTTNYAQQTTRIIFNPDKLTIDEIIQSIKTNGYTAEIIT